MPNHIQNRLKLVGSKAEVLKVREAIKGKSTKKGVAPDEIDFNTIDPMPEILRDQEPHMGVIDTANYVMGRTHIRPTYGIDLRTCRPDEFESFIQCCKSVRETGCTYWYDFAKDHWGTKWNAYESNDQRNKPDLIWFQTAWSAPFPVIKKLSAMFPKVTFELAYADEDIGSNTGWVNFKNGEEIGSFKPESGSNTAYEMAFSLRPDYKQYYKKKKGVYEHIEE